MLVLLFALQMSTTNCIPDYAGGMNCTTMSTQPPELAPLPQAPTVPRTTRNSSGGGLIGLIERSNDRALRKKIGKLMAAGDCEGAAKLAYESGWLEIGTEIKLTCTAPKTADRPRIASVAELKEYLREEVEALIARGDCDLALQLAEAGELELSAGTMRECEK